MTISTAVYAASSALALLWFAALSVVVVVTDLRWRRIPNLVVLPALAGLPTLLTLHSLVVWFWLSRAEEVTRFADLLIGFGAALTLFGVYLLVACLGGAGGGDVKLTPVLGLLLGYFGGWTAVLLGTMLAWGAAGAWVMARDVAGQIRRVRTRRSSRDPPTLPFAPFLIGGAWAALLVSV